ncbi:hypothetical protein ACFV8Z_08405, partial [Streptomyces sp. NPDC059837]
MTSAKKQTQVRLEEDVLAAGRAAAAARRLDFNKYVERLIIEDTTGARGPGVGGAPPGRGVVARVHGGGGVGPPAPPTPTPPP